MVTPQQHDSSTARTPTPYQEVTQRQGLDVPFPAARPPSSTARERMARCHPGTFWVKGLGTARRFGQAPGMVQLEGDLAMMRPNDC